MGTTSSEIAFCISWKQDFKGVTVLPGGRGNHCSECLGPGACGRSEWVPCGKGAARRWGFVAARKVSRKAPWAQVQVLVLLQSRCMSKPGPITWAPFLSYKTREGGGRGKSGEVSSWVILTKSDVGVGKPLLRVENYQGLRVFPRERQRSDSCRARPRARSSESLCPRALVTL